MFVCVPNRKRLDVGRQVQRTRLSRKNMVTVLITLAIITQAEKFWAQEERQRLLIQYEGHLACSKL